MTLRATALSIALITSSALPGIAQDINAFEHDLDQTIRSACHSFMVDALPDAISWLRTEIYENSPFCLRVEGAGDEEALGAAVRDTFSRLGPGDVRLDLSQKQDRDLNVTIECDSDYMCMETRLAFQETDTPVSQSDYRVIEAYCDERYGCIQAYFENWPAPLPTPMPIADAEMIRFDDVLTSSIPIDAALSGEAKGKVADISDTSPTHVDQTKTQVATAADATLPDDVFVLGPPQVWEAATAYCDRLGRRLPTVAEGQKIHEQISYENWWFGMWTSEVSYMDAFVQQIRTVRPGGAPSTEKGRVWEALTVCVN